MANFLDVLNFFHTKLKAQTIIDSGNFNLDTIICPTCNNSITYEMVNGNFPIVEQNQRFYYVCPHCQRGYDLRT